MGSAHGRALSCSEQTGLGAYVLHALERDEAMAVQRHIASCPDCQDEVVSLSWAAAQLRRLTLEDFDRLNAGQPLDDRTEPAWPPGGAAKHTTKEMRNDQRT